MAKELYKKLKLLRQQKRFSQERLASELNVSRPTYREIEKGERELKISEATKLAQVFDISLEDFLAGRESVNPVVTIPVRKERERKDKNEIRINIPQEKANKFEQVLLYILAKIGGKPNIGQTVLYKLLYFIDFDYYEKFEEQLIGAKYIKNHYGPTPIMFAKIIDRQKKGKKLKK